MIVTLTGPNSYMLQQALSRLQSDFVAEHTDIGLERFDGDNLEPERLPAIVQALPFLASRRMVVLRCPSGQKALAEQLEKLLTDVPDTTNLVIVEPSLDKRTSYYKNLRSQTDLQVFEALNPPALATWSRQYAKEQGGNLSSAAVNYLINRVGTNQMNLAHELHKLVQYDPNITQATIDLLTDRLPQSSVFEMLDAAFAGQPQRALTLYQDQRRQNVEPQAILAMIAWQLHVLTILKTGAARGPADLASQAKLNPYVVRKSLTVATKLPLKTLKVWVQEAYQLDVRLKSVAIDADEALQTYLMKLAN